MKVLFFRHEGRTPHTAPAAPTGYRWTLWRPGPLQWRPDPSMPLRYLIWWLLHYFRLFANRDYAILVVYAGARAVHRSAVFPRWLRSPFMSASDLQVGDTWTALDHRGRGLATFALHCITSHLAAPSRRFWYLVEASNEASVKAVGRAGFVQVGEGERQPRFGIQALGAYRLVHTASQCTP